MDAASWTVQSEPVRRYKRIECLPKCGMRHVAAFHPTHLRDAAVRPLFRCHPCASSILENRAGDAPQWLIRLERMPYG
jgi:hypothetical protein